MFAVRQAPVVTGKSYAAVYPVTYRFPSLSSPKPTGRQPQETDTSVIGSSFD